jgi:hypothetical protein
VVADWRICVLFWSGQGQAAGPSAGGGWAYGRVPGGRATTPRFWGHWALVELHAPRTDLGRGVLDHCAEMHVDGGVRVALGCVYDDPRPRNVFPQETVDSGQAEEASSRSETTSGDASTETSANKAGLRRTPGPRYLFPAIRTKDRRDTVGSPRRRSWFLQFVSPAQASPANGKKASAYPL